MIDEKLLLNESISIGDELLDVAIKTNDGWYWKTVIRDYDEDLDKYSWEVTGNLYIGVAGIALFFLELYKKTKEKRFIKATKKGTEWLEYYCSKNPTENYSFYCGRMGISYLFLQLYLLSGNNKYLEKSLIIAENCDKFLKSSQVKNDLITGVSGTLLGLLHLYNVSEKDWVLDKIAIFVNYLIKQMKHAEDGIYWDINYRHAKPLCGFAHGTSGIGYVFLELGYYFENKAFYNIAEQAFRYEDAKYDKSKKNWPDFRIRHSKKHYKTAYLEENWNFFNKPKFMTAWCHGAPGIGLSRIRALQLLNKEQYRYDLINSIKHTYRIEKNMFDEASFTLCHASGGNALLFIDAYQKFGNKKYKKYAMQIADRAIKNHNRSGHYIPGYGIEKNVEDTSLFMGKAGIGYFYLQCLSKRDDYNNVLAPTLNNTHSSTSSIPEILKLSKGFTNELILNKVFPRTLKLIKSNHKDRLLYFLKHIKNDKSKIDCFKYFISSISGKLEKCNYERIKDVFALEKKRHELKVNINPAHLSIQKDIQIYSAKKMIEMSDKQLNSKVLKLNNTIEFYSTKWDWNENKSDVWEKNFVIPAKNYRIMFYKKRRKVVEFPEISDFTYFIFQAFSNPKTLYEAKKIIFDSLELDKKDNQVLDVLMDQIREGIKARILVSYEAR